MSANPWLRVSRQAFKKTGILCFAQNDTRKVRAESHKEKGAVGAAARPTLKTVEF
jgi:hypothetical protein